MWPFHLWLRLSSPSFLLRSLIGEEIFIHLLEILVLFICSTFTRNTVVGGGVVSTAYYPLSFRGKNVFELSHGPSLVIVGTRVSVSGSLLFSTNSNTGSLDGGSLYITSLGQVQLNPGATITFVNNSGTLETHIHFQFTFKNKFAALIYYIFFSVWVHLFLLRIQPFLMCTPGYCTILSAPSLTPATDSLLTSGM